MLYRRSGIFTVKMLSSSKLHFSPPLCDMRQCLSPPLAAHVETCKSTLSVCMRWRVLNVDALAQIQFPSHIRFDWILDMNYMAWAYIAISSNRLAVNVRRILFLDFSSVLAELQPFLLSVQKTTVYDWYHLPCDEVIVNSQCGRVYVVQGWNRFIIIQMDRFKNRTSKPHLNMAHITPLAMASEFWEHYLRPWGGVCTSTYLLIALLTWCIYIIYSQMMLIYCACRSRRLHKAR